MDEANVISEYKKLAKYPEHYDPHVDNPRDVSIASKFLGWCRKHQIEPLAALTVRFRRCKRLPQWNQLCSERVIFEAQVLEVSDIQHRKMKPLYVQQVHDLQTFNQFDDQVRRRYWEKNDQAMCRFNPFSGGYDPRSGYCGVCPASGKCAHDQRKDNGFDVVALRRGQHEGLPQRILKALQWVPNGSVPV